MIENNKTKPAKSFLQRLRKDTTGNVLVLVAAGLPALFGVIGSGVDLSRAYMVKTRLQQACDAGVLAGRRAMGEGTYDTNAQTQTANFFKANFPDNYLDTTDPEFEPTNISGSNKVTATASVKIPTIIMKMFGKYDIEVSVDCQAVLEISNSDVTFVLDTTGSMACPDNSTEAQCATYFATYGAVENQNSSSSRMQALRQAMTAFNDIVETAASGTGSRIRYAMVPYTGSVNVGEILYDTNKAWLIGGTAGDTYQYQTRQGLWTKPDPSGQFSYIDTVYEELTQVDVPECRNRFSENQSISGYWNTNQKRHITTNDQYFSGNPITIGNNKYQFYFESWNGSNANPDPNKTGSSYWKTCKRRVDRYNKTLSYNIYMPGTTFKGWTYGQFTLAVDGLVDSIKTTKPEVKNPASETGALVRWRGCIQERQTIASNSVTYSGLLGKITPAEAIDLDIDKAPTADNSTKWRPDWNDVAYYRNAGTVTATSGTKAQIGGCPQKAQLLTKMTKSQFSTYVNSLSPNGATYHDIGMLWGARLSSPKGIFASNVLEAPTNSGFVSRNLIFMTDGQLDTSDRYPSAYGIERHDGLVAGGDEDQASANHKARFLAICDATRAKGIRVWVIAFGTAISDEMRACASANSVFPADNATDLTNAFVTIATAVSDLRLSQ